MAKKHASGLSDLAKASHHRLEDARALFRERRWRGSMYMGGYAVECLLKTKLMERFQCRNLEQLEIDLHKRRRIRRQTSVFTHEISLMVNLLGCRERLRRNLQLWRDFNHACQWSPAWRYWADPATKDAAGDFIAAVARLLHWIGANT
jgi:hypothetical protein